MTARAMVATPRPSSPRWSCRHRHAATRVGAACFVLQEERLIGLTSVGVLERTMAANRTRPINEGYVLSSLVTERVARWR